MKRVFDLAVALLLLLPATPVMLLLALLVRLTSPGPAFFTQTRLGRDCRPFVLYKLRTMTFRREPIDQVREGVLRTSGDQRITRLGRLLRASSLDELPQLLNILRGDMSLVGPRPLLPEQLPAIPAAYRARFRVLPGLTGLAQVRGRRSLDWLDQLAADAEYAERSSLLLDIQILLGTVVVVLRRDGVYGKAARNWREYL